MCCQENCPVSPKAIFTRTEFRVIRNGFGKVQRVDADRITIDSPDWSPGKFGSGDFFVTWEGGPSIPIQSNTSDTITLRTPVQTPLLPQPGQNLRITVRLQKPYVDPSRCIGCGVCEHECPVRGERAIRITAENETRHPRRRMIIRSAKKV